MRRYAGFDDLRTARGETLDLVAGVEPQQIDQELGPGRWTLGEILDHLVRSDLYFFGEIDQLIDKLERGRPPVLARGFSVVGGPLAAVPLFFRWPLEGTVAFWNATIPPRLRQWALRQRGIRAQAPPQLIPRRGRSLDELRRDLASVESVLDRLERDHADTDLTGLVYYNPVVGFTNVPGLAQLDAAHDRRHQQQIREALEALGAAT